MRLPLLVPVLMALVACGGGGAPHHTLVGTLTLNEPGAFVGQGPACAGVGGFSDIRDGSQVTVRDGSGTVLGLGRLSATGRAEAIVSQDDCRFDFTVAALPERAFYQISVVQRGPQTFSLADLKNSGWKVGLTLGS